MFFVIEDFGGIEEGVEVGENFFVNFRELMEIEKKFLFLKVYKF